jgi:hypothetical protein
MIFENEESLLLVNLLIQRIRYVTMVKSSTTLQAKDLPISLQISPKKSSPSKLMDVLLEVVVYFLRG